MSMAPNLILSIRREKMCFVGDPSIHIGFSGDAHLVGTANTPPHLFPPSEPHWVS